MPPKPSKRERFGKLLEPHTQVLKRVFRSRSPEPSHWDAGLAASSSNSVTRLQQAAATGTVVNLSEGQATNQANLSPIPSPIIQIDGSASGGNMRDTASAAIKASLTGLQKIANMVPALKPATDILVSCFDTFPILMKNREDYNELSGDIATAMDDLKQYLEQTSSFPMNKQVEGVIRELFTQAERIRTQQERTALGAYFAAEQDTDELVRYYRRIEALFRQLQSNAILNLWKITNENLDITNKNHVNTLLRELHPVNDARYDSSAASQIGRTGCTLNTRQLLLQELQDWAGNPRGAQIYWMNGMAGTGKTTISYSLCSYLEAANQLAASFFCSRSLPDCREAKHIVPTIAYQLARFCQPYQDVLCQLLDRDPDVGGRSLRTQFEKLVYEPMQQIKHVIPHGLFIIVIDALDECSDRVDATRILDILLLFAKDLPVKFFVTCRPDSSLLGSVKLGGDINRQLFHLHDIEQSIVQADIETYLKSELGGLHVSDAYIHQLAEQSGKLFIHAATTVRYIGPKNASIDHNKRLEILLGMTPSQSHRAYVPLDQLYATILSAALEDDALELWDKEAILLTLHTVVCAKEPLTLAALAHLLQLESIGQVMNAIQPLWSVMHISDYTGLVSTLHASFPDYLHSEKRSGRFFCDERKHGRLLAQRCFETMFRLLRFNICGFRSSFILDKNVPDLATRTDNAIPLHLSYSCRYWSKHLLSALEPDDLLRYLEQFLRHYILFWTEVMNVKNSTHDGALTLLDVYEFMKVHKMPDELCNICQDAQKFITVVGGNSVYKSTPHIYISVLAFWDKAAPIWVCYGSQVQGLIKAWGPALDNRELAAVAVWKAEGGIFSIAVSPDGRCLASGSSQGSITVWDTHSGAIILGPIHVHTDWIYCVAFSPDGTAVASGSKDCTICLLDAKTGHKKTDPLMGHTDAVWSVSYSPNGDYIASGASDGSIRVWHAKTGLMAAGPFEGYVQHHISISYSPCGRHIASQINKGCSTICILDAQTGKLVLQPTVETHSKGTINSISYSPDGSRIASGSSDSTIRVWDTSTGESPLAPFQGHTDAVRTVSYSFSGDHIVSGSHDGTVRIWDARSGQTIAGPFAGSSTWVFSAKFLPNDKRIVSGSGDGTIRIWDIKSAHKPLHVAEGHTGRIFSIAFSPDGTYIASGADDNLVCVWGVNSRRMMAGPFRGHTGPINSVSFSPRGDCVASASDDTTVRIWDLDTELMRNSPCRGHQQQVHSVAFSPDGARLASGSADTTVCIWDASSGDLVAGPFQHQEPIFSLAYSPDGTRIATILGDRLIMLDSVNGDIVGGPFMGRGNFVAYSPRGTRVVSAANDLASVIIRNARTGRITVGPCVGHTGSVFSGGFSPNGQFIFSGGTDCAIAIWDSYTGRAISGQLYGHTDWIHSIRIAPDGHLMASASEDGAIRFWDVSMLTSSKSERSGWWTVNDDGWVVDNDQSLLLWVPPDLRTGLKWPQNVAIIHRKGILELDFTGACIGTKWTGCYVQN